MSCPAARALAAALAVAPPLAVLLWLSGAVALHAAVAAMLPLVFVAMLAGVLLLRAAGAADMPAAAAWVLGSFASALAVYVLCLCFALTAATAFSLWTLVVAGFALRYRREQAGARSLDAAEFASLLLSAAATAVWCRDIAGATQRAAHGEPLLAFVDFLIHAGVISHFGDPLAVGRGSIDLAGVSLPPYHYASYALAAVLAAPLDLPGLPLSSAVWLPLGFFTMCAGAYALGEARAGPAGGLAALGALTLVPDPASYGLHGFHWNVIALPGSSYAIGFCLLALAFLRRWSPGGRWMPLAVAGILVAGTALVRIHVFALAVPAMLMIAALAFPAVRRRIPVLLAAALAALAAFVVVFYAVVPYAVPALETMLDLMLSDHMGPTAYALSYGRLVANYGQGLALPAAIMVWLAACLGALAVLYPLSAWLVRRVRGPQGPEVEPAVFLACYLALLITAPTPQLGDSTEFTQRPYVLLYAVIAVWTASNLAIALSTGERGARRAWLALLVAAGLALPLIWSHAPALGSQPRFKWAWEYYVLRLQEGLPEAAAFLRANARPGDVFATREVTLAWGARDLTTDLVALTGMPAYLGRAYIQLSQGGSREQTVRQRYAALARIASEQDAAAATRRLREIGVQWYVVAGEGPSWDRGRARAAFSADNVAVYSAR
jgi:hypothetical protein